MKYEFSVYDFILIFLEHLSVKFAIYISSISNQIKIFSYSEHHKVLAYFNVGFNSKFINCLQEFIIVFKTLIFFAFLRSFSIFLEMILKENR